MFRTRLHFVAPQAILLLALGAIQAPAQETAPPVPEQGPSTGGWRRVSDAPPTAGMERNPEPIARPEQQSQPTVQPSPEVAPGEQGQVPPPYGVIPSLLTVQPGTYVTVRVNDPLSSDRNRAGDPFSATLMQPLVVDGVVVAARGQNVYGRVVDARKARSSTPSLLGLELTELSLVDGAQIPVRSQLVSRQGSRERAADQAGTVAGTTALGAVVGSAIGWGTGAAVGAGAGAFAGLAAVMLTRNQPTVVYPETELTFRLDSPVEISTARAPQAFRFVGPEDYARPQQAAQRPPSLRSRPCFGCGVWAAPYPYPYGGPYWGPYYGPGLGVGVFISRGGHRRW